MYNEFVKSSTKDLLDSPEYVELRKDGREENKKAIENVRLEMELCEKLDKSYVQYITDLDKNKLFKSITQLYKDYLNQDLSNDPRVKIEPPKPEPISQHRSPQVQSPGLRPSRPQSPELESIKPHSASQHPPVFIQQSFGPPYSSKKEEESLIKPKVVAEGSVSDLDRLDRDVESFASRKIYDEDQYVDQGRNMGIEGVQRKDQLMLDDDSIFEDNLPINVPEERSKQGGEASYNNYSNPINYGYDYDVPATGVMRDMDDHRVKQNKTPNYGFGLEREDDLGESLGENKNRFGKREERSGYYEDSQSYDRPKPQLEVERGGYDKGRTPGDKSASFGSYHNGIQYSNKVSSNIHSNRFISELVPNQEGKYLETIPKFTSYLESDVNAKESTLYNRSNFSKTNPAHIETVLDRIGGPVTTRDKKEMNLLVDKINKLEGALKVKKRENKLYCRKIEVCQAEIEKSEREKEMLVQRSCGMNEKNEHMHYEIINMKENKRKLEDRITQRQDILAELQKRKTATSDDDELKRQQLQEVIKGMNRLKELKTAEMLRHKRNLDMLERDYMNFAEKKKKDRFEDPFHQNFDLSASQTNLSRSFLADQPSKAARLSQYSLQRDSVPRSSLTKTLGKGEASSFLNDFNREIDDLIVNSSHSFIKY